MNKPVLLLCITLFLSLVAGQSPCKAELKLSEQSGWTEDHTPQRIFSVVLTNTHDKCTIKDGVSVAIPQSSHIKTAWGLMNNKLVGFSTLAPGQSHSGIGFIYSGYGTPAITVQGYDKCECEGDVDPQNPTTPPTDAPVEPTNPATEAPTLQPTLPPTQAPTFPPVDAPSYHLDLKFLVLTCNKTDHRLNVVKHALDAVGSVYDIVDFPTWGSAPFELTNTDGSGKYYAIVSAIELFCWSATQTAQIAEYENIFRVKTVIMYSFPYLTNGVSASVGYPISSTEAYLSFASSFEMCTHSLNFDAHIPVKGVYAYKASIANPDVATPAVYLNDGADKYVAAAFIHYPDGRDRLEFYVDQADWALYPVLLGSAWLEWVSNGVFAGARRIEFNAHMDDIFMSTGMFDPAIGKEGEIETYRMTPEDIEAHVEWQENLNAMLGEGSNFTLTFPYNGATVGEKGGFTGDALFIKAKELLHHFIWESHTFTHPYLDEMSYKKVKEEYTKNDPTAMELFDVTSMQDLQNNPIYCSKSTVTPSITGLFNPDALRAMYEYGIRFVVGDNSRPELVPANLYHSLHTTVETNGIDGIYILPRHATNIYYDASLPHNIEEEWEFHYGATQGAYTFAEVVAKDVAIATASLLSFRHDPFMFHQANLRMSQGEFEDGGEHSLLTYWVDQVIASVRQYTPLPIRSHSHDLLGQMYLNREANDACGFSGKLKIDKASGSVIEVTATATGECTFPVSGFEPSADGTSANVDFEEYGTEKTSWLPFTPGANFVLKPKAPLPRL